MGGTPIVMNVGSRRDCVPIADTLEYLLLILIRGAKQEIGKVPPAVLAVELELPLCVREVVLQLLVNGKAPAHLQLVRSFGPRHIIANLIVVGRIVPGKPAVLEGAC
jgi:hypothetical protein